ncbi:MAG: response regulator [Legionella sp.]|nr:response regulator [Legionella sp.]
MKPKASRVQSVLPPMQRLLNLKLQQDLPTDELVEHIINYFENIIECMPGNVYWLDKEGKAVGCNQNVLDMFGMNSIDQFRGLDFDTMGSIGHWTEQATTAFKKDTLIVLKTGIAKLNVEEPPIPHWDGRMIHFLTHRVPLFNQQHDIIGVVGISIDITDRKQLETALNEAKIRAEAANQAKTEFLANMSHDLRTPLSGITGFASIIKEEASEPKIREYAESLSESSDALLLLLNEILDVIKISSGATPLTRQKFNLKTRLLSVIQLNKAKAYQKGITLKYTYDDALPKCIISDAMRVHRIALELVTNGLMFTETGYVSLSVHLAQEKERELVLKLCVEDTGMGIPQKQQDEIFMPFKRLNPSFEGRFQGAGLGLSLVHQYINELEGEIYVESTKGKGSRFICLIPVRRSLTDDAFGAATDEVNAVTPPLKGAHFKKSAMPSTTTPQRLYKVLVVEDNNIAATVATIILGKLGCNVINALTGFEAISHIKEHGPFDLIFMDIGLPDIDGYETTKRIRILEQGSKKTTPIVALTAHGDEEHRERALQIGMNAIITKPLTKERAQAVLCEMIAHFGQKEEHPISVELSSDTIKETKIIDEAFLATQVGGNEVIQREILTLLSQSLAQELSLLRQEFQNQEWEVLAKHAHQLKSSASYSGALRLKEACTLLEHTLKEKQTPHYESRYQLLLQEIDNLSQKLSQMGYTAD